VGLSVHAQIVDDLRLEEKAGEPDLGTEQTLRVAPKAATAREGSARWRLGVAARRTRERSCGFQLGWSSIKKRRLSARR